jgi:5'-nucleotidase
MSLVGEEPEGMINLRPRLNVLLVISAVVASLSGVICAGPTLAAPPRVVRFTILQMNDVYEITPVGGEGGLARVATLRKRLIRNNPNTSTVLDGDLFSPSALGTARVNGARLAGKQIVDVMNRVGLDYFTFGNHEFDPSEEQFHQRFAESRFKYLSSNVTDAKGQLFPDVPLNRIIEIRGAAGIVKVGLFGLTVDSNKKPYVSYSDPFKAAETQVNELGPKVDVLIALTHLIFEDDFKLANLQPRINLILGGHEHVYHRFEKEGVPSIYKADANARTVWIHYCAYDLAARRLKVNSILREIGPSIPEDPAVKRVVDQWVKTAFDGFRKDGFEPTRQVAVATEPLDGSEISVRSRPTALTRLIAEGMRTEMPEAEVAIYNGGSIRIDDVIQPGPISEYDVIRILPFGGKTVLTELKGGLLQRVLDQGLANRDSGGFLQTSGATHGPAGQTWTIGAQLLVPERTYKVAVNDFLLSGAEQGLGFFTRTAEGLTVIREGRDIRQTTVTQFQRAFPPAKVGGK